MCSSIIKKILENYEKYRKDNTPVDWVIRDLMIEINSLRKLITVISVCFLLYGIADTFLPLVFAEPEEWQEGDFLAGVDGVTNVTFGNDTSHLLDTNNHEREK